MVQPKNKPPAPKAKGKTAIQKEKTRQREKKRKDLEDDAKIVEIPIPKKTRAKHAPVSQVEEGVKDILRAAKKAAAKPTPAKKM